MDLDKKYLTERLASRGKNINDARADDDNFFNMITSYLAACSGKDNILSSRDDIDISQYHDKVKNFKTALQELKTTNEEMEAIAWLTKTDKKPNTVKKEKRKSTSRVEEMKAIMKRFDEERSISALKNEIKGLNGVNLEEVLHEMEHMVTVISKLKKDKKSLEIVLEKTKNEHFEDTLRQTDELITASAEHKKEKNDLEKKLRDSRNDLDNIKHELNTKTVEFLKVISEHNEERTKIENELKKIKNELEVANGELNTVAGKHLPLSVESKKENIFLKNQLNKIKQDLEKAKQKSKEENQFSKGQLKECKHESERVKEELKKEKYFMETQLQEYKNALEMAREELQEERKSKNSQLEKHESTSTEAEKEFARQKLFLNNKMQKYKNECNAIEDFIDTYLHEGISKTCKDLKFEQSPITNKLNSFIHNFQGIREERDLLHKNLQKLEEQSQKVQYSKKEWSELENILSSVQIPENNSSEVCEGEDSLQSTVLDKTKTLIRDFELIKIENKFVTEGLEMKLKECKDEAQTEFEKVKEEKDFLNRSLQAKLEKYEKDLSVSKKELTLVEDILSGIVPNDVSENIADYAHISVVNKAKLVLRTLVDMLHEKEYQNQSLDTDVKKYREESKLLIEELDGIGIVLSHARVRTEVCESFADLSSSKKAEVLVQQLEEVMKEKEKIVKNKEDLRLSLESKLENHIIESRAAAEKINHLGSILSSACVRTDVSESIADLPISTIAEILVRDLEEAKREKEVAMDEKERIKRSLETDLEKSVKEYRVATEEVSRISEILSGASVFLSQSEVNALFTELKAPEKAKLLVQKLEEAMKIEEKAVHEKGQLELTLRNELEKHINESKIRSEEVNELRKILSHAPLRTKLCKSFLDLPTIGQIKILIEELKDTMREKVKAVYEKEHLQKTLGNELEKYITESKVLTDELSELNKVLTVTPLRKEDCKSVVDLNIVEKAKLLMQELSKIGKEKEDVIKEKEQLKKTLENDLERYLRESILVRKENNEIGQILSGACMQTKAGIAFIDLSSIEKAKTLIHEFKKAVREIEEANNEKKIFKKSLETQSKQYLKELTLAQQEVTEINKILSDVCVQAEMNRTFVDASSVEKAKIMVKELEEAFKEKEKVKNEKNHLQDSLGNKMKQYLNESKFVKGELKKIETILSGACVKTKISKSITDFSSTDKAKILSQKLRETKEEKEEALNEENHFVESFQIHLQNHKRKMHLVNEEMETTKRILTDTCMVEVTDREMKNCSSIDTSFILSKTVELASRSTELVKKLDDMSKKKNNLQKRVDELEGEFKSIELLISSNNDESESGHWEESIPKNTMPMHKINKLKQEYENIANENGNLRQNLDEVNKGICFIRNIILDRDIPIESTVNKEDITAEVVNLTQDLKKNLADIETENNNLHQETNYLKKVIFILKRVSSNVHDSKQMNSFVFHGLEPDQKKLVKTVMNLKRENHEQKTWIDLNSPNFKKESKLGNVLTETNKLLGDISHLKLRRDQLKGMIDDNQDCPIHSMNAELGSNDGSIESKLSHIDLSAEILKVLDNSTLHKDIGPTRQEHKNEPGKQPSRSIKNNNDDYSLTTPEAAFDVQGKLAVNESLYTESDLNLSVEISEREDKAHDTTGEVTTKKNDGKNIEAGKKMILDLDVVGVTKMDVEVSAEMETLKNASAQSPVQHDDTKKCVVVEIPSEKKLSLQNSESQRKYSLETKENLSSKNFQKEDQNRKKKFEKGMLHIHGQKSGNGQLSNVFESGEMEKKESLVPQKRCKSAMVPALSISVPVKASKDNEKKYNSMPGFRMIKKKSEGLKGLLLGRIRMNENSDVKKGVSEFSCLPFNDKNHKINIKKMNNESTIQEKIQESRAEDIFFVHQDSAVKRKDGGNDSVDGEEIADEDCSDSEQQFKNLYELRAFYTTLAQKKEATKICLGSSSNEHNISIEDEETIANIKRLEEIKKFKNGIRKLKQMHRLNDFKQHNLDGTHTPSTSEDEGMERHNNVFIKWFDMWQDSALSACSAQFD